MYARIQICKDSIDLAVKSYSYLKKSSVIVRFIPSTCIIDRPIASKMSKYVGKHKNTVYKLVLTGGPCGGKTTGQARLSTFFENLGWKVFRVPETATVLLGGGVKFADLNEEQAYQFQEDLLKTMLKIEETYFHLGATQEKNTLIISDRGTMDASAFIPHDMWDKMLMDNKWNEVDLRDTRYNQIIHMVSAAKGAEAFYSTDDHVTRSEPIEFARVLDDKASQAWVGHPYFDLVDNSTDFEVKMNRMIRAVCDRLGIDTGDRLEANAKKRKFLVSDYPLDMKMTNGEVNGDSSALTKFPQFQDFDVIHDYLVTPERSMQARIRRRGQNGKWSYMHTIRRPEINSQQVELKMQISRRDYEMLLAQKDSNHVTIHKKRRCFLYHNHYFQMDIYTEPCPKLCEGLVILETYTTQDGDLLKLPDFLHIDQEVTHDPHYSMYNLSLVEGSRRPSMLLGYDRMHSTTTATRGSGNVDRSMQNGD